MNKLSLVIVLILFTISSWGQTDKRYIEVIGSAESEINPNIIVLSVRLKEFEENKVKTTLDQIEKDFLIAVDKSSIDKKNIVLADVTTNAIRQRRKERELYSQKTYEITFSRTEDVMVLLNNVRNVKLDYLDIVTLSHTEIERYRLEIKIEALKAAERKADALLNSVGVKRGKPIMIQENPPKNTFVRQEQSNTLYSVMDPESLGVSEIPLKKIKLRFEILAQFEIE
jgi:uncharacterized protein YggE